MCITFTQSAFIGIWGTLAITNFLVLGRKLFTSARVTNIDRGGGGGGEQERGRKRERERERERGGGGGGRESEFPVYS